MELYIQSNVTAFPTASILHGDVVRASMMWPNATSEQLTAAGYISVTEPTMAQPANTILVVNNDHTTAWMPTADYEESVSVRVAIITMRAKRNKLLSDCDWTQGKDVPDAVSSAWAPYRQALRDITTQSGFPQNIEWPTPPQQ